MKRFLSVLTLILWLALCHIPAHAAVLIYTVSVDGGVSYGSFNSKTTTSSSGLSSLIATPADGILNFVGGTLNINGLLSMTVVTQRDITDPATDTIVENFDYRIRVAENGPGVNTTTLGQPSPGFPYVEFRNTGNFTLANIKEGSLTASFSFPFGGDFGAPGASFQTLFLAGVGNLTLSSNCFCFPPIPQFDFINGDFRAYGMLTYGLGSAPNVRISGRLLLEGAINRNQPVTFEFKPTDTAPIFQHAITLNTDGSYSLPNLPRNTYVVRVKGAKWLAREVNLDATHVDITDVNLTLLTGDASDDNVVDITDLLVLIAHYNQVAPASGYVEAADFNGDGKNDITDLLLLIGNYNKVGD